MSVSDADSNDQNWSFLDRVKDKLNLTKHLGFVSDIDSPANQAALAAVREREEREGKAAVVPQAPLLERLKEDVNTLAETAIGATSVAAGGVAIQNQAPTQRAPKQREQFQLDATSDHHRVKEPDVQREQVADEPVDEDGVQSKGENDHGDHLHGGAAPRGTNAVEKSKGSLSKEAFEERSTAKGSNPVETSKGSASKEGHEGKSFFHLAGHAAKRLGHAVASKNLSNDILTKNSKTQQGQGDSK